VPTIAQLLGAKTPLAVHIRKRRMLLLLDNFEQVVDAAPDLIELLLACPNLRMLVTSRERLRTSGEMEYRVPPLDAPDAVALFCERARLEPDDDIESLCERLDNLPLAIELAAARTNVLSPAQILERLTDRFDLFTGVRDAHSRQSSLRAMMEWSHDLLDERERTLFAQLGIFASCTLEAAEVVCDATVDALSSLVDKSLLRLSGERFSMLETIRQYAHERLEARDDRQLIARRHADYIMALAEEADVRLMRSADGCWRKGSKPSSVTSGSLSGGRASTTSTSASGSPPL
jgi:Predicted ATPase